MTENFLVKMFEHNHWANLQIIQACASLSDEQLDAEPQSATMGSIRQTLIHLVGAQHNYLRLLSLPLDQRHDRLTLEFADLQESATHSGEALTALLRENTSPYLQTPFQTRDGYMVEPWVLVVQIINHATEHREQIKSMLSALGLTPPDIAGWEFGEFANAIHPV